MFQEFVAVERESDRDRECCARMYAAVEVGASTDDLLFIVHPSFNNHTRRTLWSNRQYYYFLSRMDIIFKHGHIFKELPPAFLTNEKKCVPSIENIYLDVEIMWCGKFAWRYKMGVSEDNV